MRDPFWFFLFWGLAKWQLITFNHLRCYSSSTALGTSTDYWKPTERGSHQAVIWHGHQKVIWQLSGSHSVKHQAVIRQSSGSHHAIIAQSSGSHQAVIRRSSYSHHVNHPAAIRQSSGNHQAVIRQSSGSHQAEIIFVINLIDSRCLRCGHAGQH